MQENNRLLAAQLNHLVSIRAAIQVIMVYLPSCASGNEPSREAVMRLVKALAEAEKDLRNG
jgi:hypothetical protein